ncbi:MAG: DNA-binding protein [Candidatus Altiarchaeales archaeon HGW-Altiarchaeales-1]|nr:MAG: DNA-binding protein [Candidatus Altiarchaeales archaeon HGW-Altiarchaeales-1]
MMDEYIKKWIIKALEDFKVAKHELSFPDEEVSTGAVCFHCQQVVEKLLKAYLISKNRDFGRTHDLTYLADLCSDYDKDFKKFDLEELTYYAVEIRYPDEFYIPSIEETRECFEIASKVKDFVFHKMGI